MSQITLLSNELSFPDPHTALQEPNGLLAAGGDLSPERLLNAYRHGIFPWFNDDQPILWWSPNPRCILRPENIHISKSMQRCLKKGMFEVTVNTHFAEVIALCAATREQTGTWITPEMQAAYCRLHTLGHAKSFEVWHAHQLVGGIYGISIGQAFFGESMFSTFPNASKAAIICLAKQLQAWNYQIIDCQVPNPHLFSLGATNIPREQFLSILKSSITSKASRAAWQINRLDQIAIAQFLA